MGRILSQSRVKVAAAAAVAHASDLLLLGTATHSKGRWDAMVGKEEAGPREDASRPGTRLRTKKAPFCRRDRRDEIWQRKQKILIEVFKLFKLHIIYVFLAFQFYSICIICMICIMSDYLQGQEPKPNLIAVVEKYLK